jgi:hypothetical protein
MNKKHVTMTKIEKTIRKIDDLRQFYKKIPKINTSKKGNNRSREKSNERH